MSGWGQGGGFTGDVTPAPIVGWERPDTPPGLGVRETIGSAWRIFRGHMRTLVALSAIPEAARALTIIPSLIIAKRSMDALVAFFRDFDPRTFENDPSGVAFQQQFQNAIHPEPELLVLLGVASGLAILVSFIGAALLTAAALDIVDGRRPSIGGAFRTVSAHAGALFLPAILIGLGSALLTIVPQLATPSIELGSFAREQAVSGLTGLLVFVVAIVAVVLAVRWSLAIPAILAEHLGFRAGLARSAALTQGIRLRIALTFVVYGVILAVGVGITSFVIALAVGIAARSLEAGVVAYLLVGVILGIVFAPVGSAMLAHVYRLRAPLLPTEAQAAEAPDAEVSPALPPGE